MFDPGNMKRPSPETFDQNVRLKKLCAADAPTPCSLLPDLCNHNRPVTQIGVDSPSRTSHLIPQRPVATSEYHGINHARLGILNDRSLLVLTECNDPVDFDTKACLASDDGVETFDGGSPLADEEDAVGEVCFGVVSSSTLSTCTATNVVRFL
jgi:hypothetical protein